MIAGRVVSSVAHRQVRYVTAVPPAEARGLVAAVYTQAQQETRLVTPPLRAHSPAPEVLAACWMLVREPLVAGAVSRTVKEAVATAISTANTCPYCADMHSTSLYELAGETAAEAILAGDLDGIDDARIRDLVRWAANTDKAGTDREVRVPMPAAERAELVGMAVAFHYLTRMVNVFLPNTLLPAGVRGATRRRLKQGISVAMRPALRTPAAPGRALPLLATAPATGDPGWASGNATIAEAMTRAYAQFEVAGRRSLPEAARRITLAQLDRWHGEPPGISARWCEPLLVGLDQPQRAAARLAVLVAVSSFQVDTEVVAEFRRWYPADETLVEAVAWASCAAARLIGQRQQAG